jgi:hypothetical protein
MMMSVQREDSFHDYQEELPKVPQTHKEAPPSLARKYKTTMSPARNPTIASSPVPNNHTISFTGAYPGPSYYTDQ